MEFLVSFLVTVFVLGAGGMYVTRRAVRVIHGQARAVIAGATLAGRSYALGPVGEVARLRRELARSVLSVRRALAVARSCGAPVGDVASLQARLAMAADTVDGELRLLEALRDHRRIAAGLADPRARALVLMSAADDLTQGLLDAAGRLTVDVALLQAECALEAQALRAQPPVIASTSSSAV